MIDELMLRRTVRDAILDGRLPCLPPETPGGRPATGAECAVCKRPTTDGEHKLTYEEGLALKNYFMHPACFRIFLHELQSLARRTKLLYQGGEED